MKNKLEIGGYTGKDWLVLDSSRRADIKLDLRKCDGLPFKNESIEKAFSSHCIQLLDNEHIKHLFRELYRVMKQGAVLRLSCPDPDICLKDYKKRREEMIKGGLEMYKEGMPASTEDCKVFLSKKKIEDWYYKQVEDENFVFNCINWLNYKKIKEWLKEAGFDNIRKACFNDSVDEEMKKGFDRHREVSLYVETIK